MASIHLRLGQVLKNSYKGSVYFHRSAPVNVVKLPVDEAEVNYIDHSNTCHKMSFAQLKVLATDSKTSKQRQLLHVQTTGKPQSRPTFRLANQRELEVLVHKSRVDKVNSYFLVNLDAPEDPKLTKLKEKMFTISLDAMENVIESTVKKARKSLEKGHFVVLKFENRGHKASEVKEFETVIKERCLKELEDKESQLVIMHK